MFFILSKVLVFIITPIVWIVALLIISLFTKKPKRKRRTFIAALILLLFFSNSFLLDNVMRMWEIPAVSEVDLKDSYDVGIVLGGMMSYDSNLDRLQFSKGVDRILQAIQLYKDGVIEKILITSGSGSITYSDIKEAPLIKKYLLTLEIPEEDILIESESKNTRENALFSKPILDKEAPEGKYLLITSAFHMRRSIGCFKKVGIKVTPFSTDRYSGGPRRWALDFLLIPNVEAFHTWNVLIHEMTGYWVYKIMGYV